MVETYSLLDDPDFQAFMKAWEKSRSCDGIPLRKDITLQLFAKFIPNMMVLEHAGPREYRYCQAGEGVKDRLGMKGTGLNFFDLLHPEIIPLSEQWWGGLLQQPCGGIVTYSIEYPEGMLRHAASIVLPVRRTTTGPDMLVGVTKILGERFNGQSNGQTVIGEFFAHGVYFDLGFGAPPEDKARFLHAPNPDFLSY